MTDPAFVALMYADTGGKPFDYDARCADVVNGLHGEGAEDALRRATEYDYTVGHDRTLDVVGTLVELAEDGWRLVRAK